MLMPTLVGQPVGCAFAALAVGSNAEESEVAIGELVAPVSAPALLDYVSVYGRTVVSNHKIKQKERE